MSIRRTFAIVMVTLAAAGTLVLTGSPAQAAMPYCNNISGVRAFDAPDRIVFYPTVGTGSPTVACNMGRINNNPLPRERVAIRQLQWSLNRCYGKHLVVDGEYGTLTKGAVLEVQRYLNGIPGGELLAEDGWAGPKTRAAMAHVDSYLECSYPGDNPPVILVGQVPYYGPIE